MTTSGTKFRGGLRGIAALSIAAGLGWSVPLAAADIRPVTGLITGQTVADIRPARTIDLMIVKKAANPYDDVRPGELPPGTVTGVTFTVQRVNGIDLTTEVGWATARGMTVAQAKNLGFDLRRSGVTDVDGKAAISGLPVGLYLITETAPADPSTTYETSAEVLITLPTGSTDGGSWNYDVTVNTKDQPDAPDPTSTPSAVGEPGRSDSPDESGVPATPAAGISPGAGTVVPDSAAGERMDDQSRGSLAETGAGILGLIVGAVALIGLGTLLVRRDR